MSGVSDGLSDGVTSGVTLVLGVGVGVLVVVTTGVAVRVVVPGGVVVRVRSLVTVKSRGAVAVWVTARVFSSLLPLAIFMPLGSVLLSVTLYLPMGRSRSVTLLLWPFTTLMVTVRL